MQLKMSFNVKIITNNLKFLTVGNELLKLICCTFLLMTVFTDSSCDYKFW